ncbi:ankyrin repeat-containing protein At5g02620-like [Hevea brasiliensis]|uniref:ankyrin repeat-containing protein At5g02620-like n=1 Tax=Hevea brasiliensis TaxID=3981 RepID=UPI0025DF5C00|nr:ankyrin repeat-containing protein At5g02620-like [Hevea brasiliensis]
MEVYTHIDDHLQKAAAEGNFKPFKDYRRTLPSLLTSNKNTILHIYLTSSDKRSTKFIKKVLRNCTSLLRDVNVHGDTPLHIAARYGHADVAEELIKWAKASMHNEIAIESGEGPREREIVAVRELLRVKNRNGETALHEAARNEKSLGVVEAILSNEDPLYSYSANNYGETPLYLAAQNGCEKIVLELLNRSNSQSPEYGGPNGKTALHAATMHRRYSKNCYPCMIDALLDKWSSLAKQTDDKGWTPLHYAVYKCRTRAVQKLLDKDISTAYIADKDGKRTALHIAACRDFKDGVEMIISKCPGCCELTDIRGWNVLHYAVISKSDEVLKALLQHSSLIYLLNGKDAKENTPVHLYNAYHSDSPSFIEGDSNMFFFWKKLHKEIQIAGYSSSKKNDNLEWMKDVGNGPIGEIQKEKRGKRTENKILQLEKVKDSHLVAAALIATVTFAAAFTLPGGCVSDEKDMGKAGTPILSKILSLKAFMISDIIALVLFTCSVFIHLMLVIIGYQERCYWLIRFAFNFLFYAMVAMMITFVTGTYAVLTRSLGYVVCVFGLSFFFFFFLTYSMTRVTCSFLRLIISYDSDDEDVQKEIL